MIKILAVKTGFGSSGLAGRKETLISPPEPLSSWRVVAPLPFSSLIQLPTSALSFVSFPAGACVKTTSQPQRKRANRRVTEMLMGWLFIKCGTSSGGPVLLMSSQTSTATVAKSFARITKAACNYFVWVNSSGISSGSCRTLSQPELSACIFSVNSSRSFVKPGLSVQG